ncbi:NAD-dependent malic enzyme [Bacteriovorax stolpii]|uniref:malate dehydrogenase (oxaloacetate-decarboxylating) n=1 Tax=Bacteriovorax stolpii TaxID=960 RepID=A0A2K9NUF1_BACTC|nr:NAD-dependent malic enzyme [Bacteriovorax stolpii]AUN99117.1 NAD-dependent malic enzyme [Bacteriovorax stolpii]TDP55351.1 NAD-dependent malic enzyme [Bacteriovorax stolpii]
MHHKSVAIPYTGTNLLEISLLNKGSAFSERERAELHLHGLVPPTVETIEEQAERVTAQYSSLKDDLEKHIFLRHLQDVNETLFYHFVVNNVREMLPLIYTPTVGKACQHFSNIYRASRGLFISYPNRERIDEILSNVTKRNVKVIVVTDGGRVLGLGDQGLGGMGISIGKLSLYTACAGVSPAYTLPVALDVGTDNQQLINDPQYMGWRHSRVTGKDYEDFIDAFVQAVKRRWPDVLLQFEDFAQTNAMPILQKYRDQLCCFNDDIQGTAAVTLGSLMAAGRTVGKRLSDQRIAFLGAGAAGCGIAEKIISRMKHEGLSDSEARSRVFMIDRFGLLTDQMPNLLDFQVNLAQKSANLPWAKDHKDISLFETVQNAKPTVLIGVSGQPGLFTEEIIKEMYAHCKNPIVMPLSNPTSRAEALPVDIIRWTEGNALVATGSPFAPVEYNGKVFPIAQCNNSYIFPGIGLAVIASGAKRVTNNMLMASSEALADVSPMALGLGDDLLPAIEDIEKVSRAIAFKVGKVAQKDGVAPVTSDAELLAAIDESYWYPVYRDFTLKK